MAGCLDWDVSGLRGLGSEQAIRESGNEDIQMPLCPPPDAFCQELSTDLLWESLLKPFSWNTFWKIEGSVFSSGIGVFKSKHSFVFLGLLLLLLQLLLNLFACVYCLRQYALSQHT